MQRITRRIIVAILFMQMPFLAQELPQETLVHLKPLDERAIVPPTIWKDSIKQLPETAFNFAVDVVRDTLSLHRNLFTTDTLKIVGAFAPFYLASYLVDSKIHKTFYDADHHKNRNQLPHNMAGNIRGVTFGTAMALSSLAIVGPTPTLRETSRVFAIGYVSGLFLKDTIKKVHMRPALRPLNENFNAEERSYGGFPSGHMFEASYMTVVYGLQYGLWAIIPLGTYTASLFASSIISNRHYTSQAIAGIALGTVYGIAAHKVIRQNLSDKFSVDFGANEKGDPAMTFTYRF